MRFATEYLWFETKAQRGYLKITDQVERVVAASGIGEGMVLVSAMHITAGVYVNDAEPGIIRDFDDWAERLGRSFRPARLFLGRHITRRQSGRL